MPTLSWYLKRAQAMSVVEVIHRTKLELKKRSWRKKISAGSEGDTPFTDWNRFTPTKIDASYPADKPQARRLLEDAEAFMRHEWNFFNLEGIPEEEIDWSLDPESGKRADLKFAFDIDHRDEERVGNIKITWEKNRHNHLTVLATAYFLTGDERFAKEVSFQILDWIAKNPFLLGVNWTHPLEQGIRLIAWVWCERLLRGSNHHHEVFGPQSPVWTSIYQHQVFIEATYSRGSSANNHLIGEMAGLFIASTAWPIFNRSTRWHSLSRHLLEREIIRQTFPSGINREMAFSYHLFTLEFLLLTLLEAKSHGISFPEECLERVRRQIEVIPLLTDTGGNLPRFGDGDEGMAIQLQARGERRDLWLLEAGKELLEAYVPSPQTPSLAASILGCPSSSRHPCRPPAGSSLGFEDAGLYILCNNRHTLEEIFVLADAGPHGYLSIAAHAHADALAFTLSAGGLPILVDPGTYAYHTDKWWRTYFRGTRAHNTLAVDNLDQSVQAGAFLWTNKAATSVHKWEPRPNGGVLVASHDGYKKRAGVVHERKLTLEGKTLVVEDSLQGQGDHQFSIAFHFAPRCHVRKVGSSSIAVSREGTRMEMVFPEKLWLEPVRGGKTAGWYSPEFGRNEETFSVVATGRGTLPVSLRTTIRITH
ncbi:MAG: alginate lyase family protein [Opitutales bacterium]